MQSAIKHIIPRLCRILLLACLLCEPLAALYAAPAPKTEQNAKKLTPAQKKREAAKRKAARKRAAKKAAAAKKAEKKRQAAKRQRIKDGKPLLYVYSYNLKTGEPLPATHIQVQDVKARPGRKPKVNKPTDTKRARLSRGLPEGKYWIYAARR